MSNENALTVIEQKEVLFYDDTIMAVRTEGGSVYVPVRPICDLLGIDAASQRRRIYRDAVLSDISRPCDVVMTSQGMPPQRREMLCLPLEYLNGWLFGINADRVKSELRERVIRYQRECYKVLSEAFREGRLSADVSFDELLQTDTPEVRAYKMMVAMVQMARQQILLKAQLGDHEARLEATEGRVDVVEERLESIESQLGDTTRNITGAQASRISQAVKAIALELGKRSGRNEFGGVYGELYRRFEIAGYRDLPAARYEEAITFLRTWYSSLVGDAAIPF